VLFTSIDFALFLAVVLIAYWGLRGRLSAQNLLLIVASYFFYSYWDIRFLYLIVISTVVDYSCAQMIDRGNMVFRDRFKASACLIISAILFVLPDYSAVELLRNGFSFSIYIQWQQLFANALGWQVFAGSMLAVVAANLFYPYLKGRDHLQKRKLFLFVSIVANLSLLAFSSILTSLPIISVPCHKACLVLRRRGIRWRSSCHWASHFTPSRP